YPDRRSDRVRELILLQSISVRDFRGYAGLEASFGAGPQLVWGPNAAGKTSLLEAIVLLAWGRSHRTTTDSELVRWGADLARVEGIVAQMPAMVQDAIPHGSGPVAAPRSTVLEVAVVRQGSTGGRKRIRVNGVPRRATGLLGALRI